MKKLLILLALVMAIYYSTGHAKEITPSKEWIECANAAVIAEQARAQSNNEVWLNDFCGFYQKSVPECQAIMDASTPGQKQQAIQDYLFHAVIIPACGIPK
jgi:isochorismate hydrolase